MAHHDIEVTVSGKDVIPAKIPALTVGDTVRYLFKGQGKLVIKFPGLSPYEPSTQQNTEVPGDKNLDVVSDGQFQCGCQILLSGANKPIGWDPRDPVGTKKSGGDHNVRKPP